MSARKIVGWSLLSVPLVGGSALAVASIIAAVRAAADGDRAALALLIGLTIIVCFGVGSALLIDVPADRGDDPCPSCDGDGYFEGAFGCFDCRDCGGTGCRGARGR